MIRFLFRIILLAVLVVGGLIAYNYWKARQVESRSSVTVGTGGVLSPETARERGAEIGEKAADVFNKIDREIGDGALTVKIKSKMALDDLVSARRIDVDTTRGVVTVRGEVASEPEHQRAIQLAKETNGVREVVDRLEVRPR